MKNWFLKGFQEKKIPNWTCPNCINGILKLDTFVYEESAISLRQQKIEFWNPEDIRYIFSGSLKCPFCSEFVGFMGTGSIVSDIEKDYAYYTPKYFYPPLHLFEINKKWPKEISDIIIDSFSLYWNDLSSCANKIRVSLEMLMDKCDVNKTFRNTKGKRQILSLHKRIDAFKTKKPKIAEIADLLTSIKWIGNHGSHKDDLKDIDIIEVYKMLEYCLNKIYDDEEKKFEKISKEINKRKGTLKR